MADGGGNFVGMRCRALDAEHPSIRRLQLRVDEVRQWGGACAFGLGAEFERELELATATRQLEAQRDLQRQRRLTLWFR
jgi:hypothetical protein